MAHTSWTDFCVASASTAGALAGLVFVALSINLTRIIELPGVVGRAAETILLLAAALVGSLVVLIPDQFARLLGLELLAVWLVAWLLPTAVQARGMRRRDYYRLSYAVRRFILHQLATAPFLLAALSLWGLFPGGLQWFALAVLLSMAVALMNAWVLLVEIVR